MLRLPLAVITLAAAAASAHALDPGRAPSQYVITRLGDRSLRGNTVRALLQTRDGYLWLGTGAGLIRHDGARFLVIDAQTAPVIGGGGVSSLAEGADGSLYFGTTSGVVIRRRGHAYERVPLRDGGPVYALLAARDGTLWVAGHGYSLARWTEAAGGSYLSQVETLLPRALAEEPGGALWVGTQSGLTRGEAGVFRRDPVTGDLVQALCLDAAGALWVGTPHGLLRKEGGRTRRFTRADGLPHDSVAAVTPDRRGNLWIGTAGGLSRYRDGKFENLTTAEGLSDNDVRCLLEDREGNLWVGTADGLTGLSDGRFVTYGRWEGLGDPAVSAVIGAGDGGVWLGTVSAEIARLWPDGRVRRWRLPGGLGRDTVIALHEAREGTLWIALANGRVFQLRAGVLRQHSAGDARARRHVSAFFEDDEGLGALVSFGGVARLRGGRFVLEPAGDAPGVNYPHARHRDRRGATWIATSRGLIRTDGTRHELYAAKHGLPNNRVRWVSEDEDGALWIASSGGLARLADGKVHVVTLEHGIPENYARVVLDDGLGHLWVAGQGSIFRLEKRELLDLFAGRVARVSPLRFDTTDGLRTTEAVLSNNPAFRGADGRLWFATTKGVAVVDPRGFAADRPAPDVTLESPRVGGRPGRGEVTIDYTALTFTSPHRVQFRYRLHGFDADWVSAGDRRFAHYGALPAGSYRFEVTASNPDGRWNGAPASAVFEVRPSFFRRPVFYLLCTAALGLLIAAGHRMRVGQMRGRLLAIIGERTRIARELHDTLAQGVAGVGLQIETALRVLETQPESAREHLRLAHAMSRSSLDEVRRSIWVLRAQTSRGREGLAASLAQSLRQLTAGKGPEATVAIVGQPRALPVAVERNLLRIAHEAVSNAVRHSSAETMSVVLDFGDDGLRLSVKDDGRGFDFESHLAASGIEHFGLLGISERTRALGGELHVTSRPGEGTEVVCRIPYGARAEAADRDVESSEGGEG